MKNPSILRTVLNGQLQSDLFTLLSLSLASRQLAEHAAAEPSGGLRDLLDKRQHDIVIELLIRCATKIRILDDLTIIPRDSERLPPVGMWLTEKGKPESRALLLRDACNKVIHCEAMHFDLAHQAANNETTAWTGQVKLKGNDRGKSWEVLIEVEKFATSAIPYVDPRWMHEV